MNHSFHGRTKQRVGGHCRKRLEGDEKGSEGEGLEAFNHGRRTGREDQAHCVVQSSGREVPGIQQKRRVGLATSVETLEVAFRMRTKQLGVKEKARRKKCDERFSIVRKNRIVQKNYLGTEARRLLRMGFVLARVWEGEAVDTSLPERLKLRRQIAAAAGKNESVSLSLFVEVHNFEVEEELSTMATVFWAAGVWMNRWRRELQKAWRKQIFEVQRWKQVRGLAGAFMCETRDLGTQ